MPSTTARSGVGLRSERGPILLSLMLSTALVALDATIIATAASTIVRELGSFQRLPWLFSSFLLAQAVSTPVFGRLADIVGRKRLMLVGIGLFFVGSAVAGAAPSMGVLIAGRALQGLGAGAVMPVSMTITSDIYTLEERARAQGYLASVWGLSSVVGPTLGGVFTQFVSWRWIFWVNLPLAVVAAAMLALRYREPRQVSHRDPVDYLGAVLLSGGSTLLLLGLLEGGWVRYAGAAVLLAGFVVRARTARHPIIDLAILRRRVIGASTTGALLIGVIVVGLSTYVPIYAQEVLGFGALLAGFALAALTLGWPLSAAQAGRFYLRLGFRLTAVIGSSLVLVGAASMLLLGPTTPLALVAVFCFVIGAGMGLTAVPTLIAAQESARPTERGAVTGTNMFARSLGMAVGVAVLGAIVNAHTTLGADGAPHGPGIMTAMRWVFGVLAAVAVLLVAAAAAMPKDRDEAVARRAAAAADPEVVEAAA
ncbi:major facilitator superfamily MFS_1 [Xylanimonas cellulosilytica DSM 15894]|uniref:Major facilitator superfamily MFS_1 n=1 Tax=Xylanimonas cellulosilytica (strain DSM 15894 / JCM 12276 / CECT 5975 / KCTC 9989 / LMG 20990 / NBRC 107835 / XIL07) TaxID=446471 RepID=D1BUF5_XYLCX|nr:MDR family MFS transporter [Xylanimonas cellulosilytica]ACZ31168.1 major facilitator superfamily MFS_1 [Xylanimonas cellulosilytica DSM 15894]